MDLLALATEVWDWNTVKNETESISIVSDKNQLSKTRKSNEKTLVSERNTFDINKKLEER